MKEKIINFIDKYKLKILIIVIAILMLSLLYAIISSKIVEKKYANNNYMVEYDSTWRITNTNNSKIAFVHKTGSKLNFQITKLNGEYQYTDISDMLDDILYDIGKQNKNYKLLAKEKMSVTANNYDGYKILYENGKNQALVVIGKKGSQLLVITYEAESQYYDMLLDSVYNIIYKFKLNDSKVNLNYKLNLSTKKLTWSKNKEVENSLKTISSYKIANNNYLINYSIPSNFKLATFDSSSGYFKYDGFNSYTKSIDLDTMVLVKNIYEYLDKKLNNYETIYGLNKYLKKAKDTKDYKESVSKYNCGSYKCYIYKNSYISLVNEKKYSYQNVYLIYAINKNHIFEVQLKATNTTIPEKIVKMIKVKTVKNYASYSERKIVDNKQTSQLKYYTDYTRKNIKIIEITLPLNYLENNLDNSNIYETKTYNLNYDEENYIYQYKIIYRISSSKNDAIGSTDSIIEFNKTYGDYQKLSYSGNNIYNDNSFEVYKGFYSGRKGRFFSNVNRFKYVAKVETLLLKIGEGDGKYLTITVIGNDAEISDDMIKEVTNFMVK